MVGLLRSAGSYPGGQHRAQVGKWNAEGTKTIPSRHFLKRFIKDFKRGLIRSMEALWKNMLLGRFTVAKAQRNIGLKSVRELKKTINDFSQPPNAPATIRKKGFNDPLIDSGSMRDAIDWRPE